MSISLGTVAAGLLALGDSDESSGAHVAKFLGNIMMPIALCFTLYSAVLFRFRRELLRKDDIHNPQLYSTTIPVILGYILCFALCAIFILEIFGGYVHV